MPNQETKPTNQGTEILPDWADKVGIGLRLAAKISPNAVAKLMATLWFKPFMPKPKPHVLDWQEKADQFYTFANGEIAVFGDADKPLIIGVHGWRGRAHQLRRFIQPLQEKGYRVGLVNLPGHHANSVNRTDIYECANFIQAIWQEVGEVHGILAHSFGSPVSVLSFSEKHTPKKVAILAGNFDVQYLLDQYTAAFKLEALRNKVEQHISTLCDQRIFLGSWQRLKIEKVFEKMQHLKNGGGDSQFWHDTTDQEVSIAMNQEICDQLDFVTEQQVKGVGHFNILRSEEVITSVCDYFSD
jgi:hypothetical protein